MIIRKLIFVSVVIAVVVIIGAVVHAGSNIMLDGHTVLTIEGSGSCNGNQTCWWCDSSGSGSEYCSGSTYIECFTSGDPNDSCGSCTSWNACETFYKCNGAGCQDCEITGDCEGCTAASGGSC